MGTATRKSIHAPLPERLQTFTSGVESRAEVGAPQGACGNTDGVPTGPCVPHDDRASDAEGKPDGSQRECMLHWVAGGDAGGEPAAGDPVNRTVGERQQEEAIGHRWGIFGPEDSGKL